MTQDHTALPLPEDVVRRESDPRPAWLWADDATGPVWHNHAADLFGAKLGPTGLEQGQTAVPVAGQIARLQRMGLIGQMLPSRVQFMAGRRLLSATCDCTLFDLGGEKRHVLIVARDSISEDVLAAAAPADAPETPEEQQIGDQGVVEDAVEPDEASDAPSEGLSALVDRLASHDALFDSLDDDDEEATEDQVESDTVPARDYAAEVHEEDAEVDVERRSDFDDWSEHEEAAFASDRDADDDGGRARLWQISARSIRRSTLDQEEIAVAQAEQASAEPAAGEAQTRYNFEELSRILTDRVGRADENEPSALPLAPLSARAPGALVALSEESVVLNRIPIGILIFRDDEVVFANRALVDLTGYDSASTLRSLGVAAILPSVDGHEPAGPVTQLVRSDGERVSVNARLNTVTWQGRTSLMLTARSNEVESLREAEVRRFAQLWANTAAFDFVGADTSGLITEYESSNRKGQKPAQGAPLTTLLAANEHRALRHFLSLPARFAGEVRPAIALKANRSGQTLTLFAEGRAGIVTGYFGLLGGGQADGSAKASNTLPTDTLSRITRGLRSPLNSFAGFSELMTSEAFGPLPNTRYREYARDIRAAGAEIGDLADELDDFTRLAEGQMALSPADVDIATLMAECLVRVRGPAGKARVLLRSAISEKLPLARVDAATLKQAVLNMLASAINEASEGARVVLSGQVDDDGSVSIHVRDAAKGPSALSERFVVFRDGVGADGMERRPTPSSIGLTLTRSLVAVNACSLDLEPSSESGTLMTLTIPSSLVVAQ